MSIINYLKSKLKILAMLLIATSIFIVVFYFENTPLNSVLYAFLLCFFTLITYLIIDFIRLKNKTDTLNEIKYDVFNKLDNLPVSTSVDEKIYQDIISDLVDLHLQTLSLQTKKNADMSDFYTKWVHQIKTPIFALNLLINETPNNNSLLSELSKIEQYTTMVLTYIRLVESSNDFVFQSYNINDLVINVVKSFKSIFISKKIKLNININDFTIKTDKKHLEFAISQILSNAIKYTNQGQISIFNKDNTLIVADTGIGIENSDLSRIFEKGYTGVSGRLEDKSTGLGLYLCKKTLDLLGFDIKVTSKINVGTTVYINLSQL